MKKYRLIKDYPGHKIGDQATFDPRVNNSNFFWIDPNKTPDNIINEGLIYEIIPINFQPNVTPEWFEEVIIKYNYTILDIGSTGSILSVANNKGYVFSVGNAVKMFDKPTIITELKPSPYDPVDMWVVTPLGERDINAGNSVREYRFTTFDKIDIYREEPYYFVVHTWQDDWIAMRDIARCPDSGKHPEIYDYFSTREKAVEFMEKKRQQRDSLKSEVLFTLEDIIHSPNINLSDTNKAKFIALAKTKKEHKNK